jgi:hypothetical protein
MSKKKVQPLPEDAPGTKYTQERLFWNIDPDTIKDLKEAWREGDALSPDLLPDETLCAVTLLAAWAHKTGIDIVDDYDELIKLVRAKLANPGLNHPDLFMVSMICILDARGEQPTIGGFEQIGLPDLFEDLIGSSL